MNRLTLTLLVPTLLLGACASNNSSDPDVANAQSASTATESSADTAYILSYYTVSASTRQGAIADVQASMMADVDLPACITIDTDGLTYLDATFDQCGAAAGHIVIDGTLHATVTADSSGLTFNVDTTDFSIGATSVTGQWELAAAGDGSSLSWSGSTEIQGPRRSVSLQSNATMGWDGQCVTLDLDGQIDRPAGTNTLTVRNVKRCVDQCPVSGSVEIQNAVGGTLSWTYDGSDVAHVTTRSGATFDVQLACGL